MCRRTVKTLAVALEKRGRVASMKATCLPLLGSRSLVDPYLLQFFLLKCLKCRYQKQLGQENQACKIKTMVRYMNDRNNIHLHIQKTFRRMKKEKQRTATIKNNMICSANLGIKFRDQWSKKKMQVRNALRSPIWRWTHRYGVRYVT